MTSRSPLFLIGYRGSGKTSVARVIAERLGWDWLDADQVLEERAGRTIRQIFAEEGEAGFRAREAAILRELCEQKDHVIATGGGVILRPENRTCLRRGTVVWLQAPPHVLWQRLQGDATTAERRPNLIQGGLTEVEELLGIRAPLYEACQDFTVDTSTEGPEEIAAKIIAWLKEHV